MSVNGARFAPLNQSENGRVLIDFNRFGRVKMDDHICSSDCFVEISDYDYDLLDVIRFEPKLLAVTLARWGIYTYPIEDGAEKAELLATNDIKRTFQIFHNRPHASVGVLAYFADGSGYHFELNTEVTHSMIWQLRDYVEAVYGDFEFEKEYRRKRGRVVPKSQQNPRDRNGVCLSYRSSSWSNVNVIVHPADEAAYPEGITRDEWDALPDWIEREEAP